MQRRITAQVDNGTLTNGLLVFLAPRFKFLESITGDQEQRVGCSFPTAHVNQANVQTSRGASSEAE